MALQKENAEMKQQLKAAGDSKAFEVKIKTLENEVATVKAARDSLSEEIKKIREDQLKADLDALTADLKARNWSDDRIKSVTTGADSKTIMAVRETLKDISKGQPGAPAVAADSNDLPASPYLANMRKLGGRV